jgi:hypothetical protein
MYRLTRGNLTWLIATGVLLVAGTGISQSPDQVPTKDPEAMRILREMTDHFAGLTSFSVVSENTLEDELAPGQRVDYDVAARVGVRRPNKLRALRMGKLQSQEFYFDGTTLTLFLPPENTYATITAPRTIGEMLDFTREELGIILPGSDLVYDNAYTILVEGVTSAVVVGKALIKGVECDHLAFRRPDADFQLWVAAEGPPLPYKYVFTDTSTPANISTVTVFDDWKVNPELEDALFVFKAPEGAMSIEFIAEE